MPDPKTTQIVVGAIAGAHGVRGDVRVRSFTEDPETLFEFGELYDRSGEILLKPKSYRPSKSIFIVVPKSPRSKEEWDALKGTELWVPRSALPEPEDDSFYIDDLVGMHAFDKSGLSLGVVHAVLNHGAGDLIELRGGPAGAGVLVPMTLEDVPEIDLAASRLTISTFELWASDPKAEQDASDG